MLGGNIGGIPYLFRNKRTPIRKSFHCPDIFIGYTARSDFIMAALARQQGPEPSNSRAIIRISVCFLPVPIMVVPMPPGP